MTYPQFSGTRALASLACVSLVSLLAACAPAGGHYDADGKYVSDYNNGSYPNTAVTHDRHYNRTARVDYDNYQYIRRGYYDYNGYYAAADAGPDMPQGMFPPRGMCRVWFTERAPSQQPPVESCNGIRSRAPNGSYVVYGG